MNKKTLITILLTLALPVAAWAQLESVKELTMKSEYFNHERQVLIYTPGGYQQFDCLLNIACKPDPDGGRSMSFIIVGICSPTLWDINYSRNDDYLPMPLHGNNGLFQEGYHYGMVTDDLFDDYIAISPNCCYDEYRLAADIENHQFKNHKAPRFIYTSMSGEIDDGPEYWGDEWKTGWERVSTFLKDKSHFPENTVSSVQTFPGYGHYNGFMPSLTAALNGYIVFGAKNLVGYVGEETCPVHIELRGKNLTDTIYITGNQDALGNWEAKGVKMHLLSDSVASIDLRLHLPAQFKFTRGSWEREAIIHNADAGNHIIYDAKHAYRVYRLWERNQWMGE